MFSIVGASIILPFIPLLPVQVLLLNFLSDFPMLAVSTDAVDEEYLKKPKHWDISKIKKFMNYFGFMSSAFDFLTYGFLLLIVKASIPLFQVGWFWQSFLTEVLLIFVIRTRKIFFRSRPSNSLFIAFGVTVVLVLLIMYTPIAGYFGFAIMPLWVNLSLIVMSFGYFACVETGKKWFFNKYDI
jgi:Mg2+-importing ATPase